MTRAALIVAHGQPSDPDTAEAFMADLAERVGTLLPGRSVAAATLAAPGALEKTLARLPDPLIVPFFLADGYFIRAVLPRRLAAAGYPDQPVLMPFGRMPETLALIAATVLSAAADNRWSPRDTSLVLAAHGSGASPHAAAAIAAIRTHLATVTDFAAITAGFIEEPPLIADVLAAAPHRSLCLPLFAARWGHVDSDLPEAARSARFSGTMLPPIGVHPQVPALLARAIVAFDPPRPAATPPSARGFGSGSVRG